MSQIGEKRTVLEAGGSVHTFLEVEEQQSELIKQLVTNRRKKNSIRSWRFSSYVFRSRRTTK
uniref:Uncharacterized protein n=1 Tax=Myoviridae sp. ctqfO1 TaxID=2827710 RepID=A0A8S5T2N2_9CAUD|nr:MAG TPA: hypothetical protein [Myoviridae sp. ctqfO1]